MSQRGKGAKRGADGQPKVYNEAELKSQALQYFKSVAKQKKATPAEKETAATAVSTFEQISFNEKAEFAKSFYNNKNTKNFGFVKEFAERLTVTKTTSQACQENYFTRIYT